MFKTMFTIYFPDTMTREQAREHWRSTHRDLVLECEGIVKYTQNHKVAEMGGDDALPGAKQWDGVVELYFADEATYDRVMESEQWAAVMADSFNFINMELVGAGIVEEEKML